MVESAWTIRIRLFSIVPIGLLLLPAFTVFVVRGQEILSHYELDDADTFAEDAYDDFPDLALPTPASGESPYAGIRSTTTPSQTLDVQQVPHASTFAPFASNRTTTTPRTTTTTITSNTSNSNAIEEGFVTKMQLRGDAKVIEKFFELTRRHKSGYKMDETLPAEKAMTETEKKQQIKESQIMPATTTSSLPTLIRIAMGLDEDSAEVPASTTVDSQFFTTPEPTKEMFTLGNKYLKIITTEPMTSTESIISSIIPETTTIPLLLPTLVTTSHKLFIIKNETADVISKTRRAEYYRLSMLAMKSQLRMLKTKIEDLQKQMQELKDNNTCKPFEAKVVEDAMFANDLHVFGENGQTKKLVIINPAIVQVGPVELENGDEREKPAKTTMRLVGKTFPVMNSGDDKDQNQPRSTFLIGAEVPATDVALETHLEIMPQTPSPIGEPLGKDLIVLQKQGSNVGLITKKAEHERSAEPDELDEGDDDADSEQVEKEGQNLAKSWHSSVFDNQHLWPDVLFRDHLRIH